MNSQKYEQDQHDYTTRSCADTDRNSTQAPLDEQLQTVYREGENQSSLGTGFYTGCRSPSVNPEHSVHTQSWMNSHATYGLPLTTKNSGSELPRPTQHLQSLSRARTPFFPFLCQFAHDPFTPAYQQRYEWRRTPHRPASWRLTGKILLVSRTNNTFPQQFIPTQS